MKKWKRSLRNSSLLLLLIALVQCGLFDNQEPKEVFDPYDHPLLEEGDTLVYRGIAGVDSFYVSESAVYGPHGNPTFRERDYTEFCGTIHEIGASVATQICFDIHIISTSYNLYQYLCYYYYYGGENNWTLNKVVKENGGHSYTIGTYELCDLYKTPWFQNEEIVFEGKTDSVLYSKKYGIIKYWRNNETYVLTEKCLEMLMARE